MRLALSTVLVFLIVFSVSGQEAEDWYQGKPITRITFEGLSHVSRAELDGITEPFVGQIFSDDVYWDILGRLYALEYFESINPVALKGDAAGSEIILNFAVVERPVVSRITFSGNSGVRRNELLDTVSIKADDVATELKLRMDEQAIIGKYIEKGYPDAKVRSETQDSGDSTVAVVFYIEEGERIVIEGFHFEGNSVFNSRTLQRQLSLKTRGIIADGAFQDSKLIADRQTLVQYYHDRGYIDADVIDVAQEVRRSERGENLLSITFRIYEGSQYSFGGVTFEGNHIFKEDQLSALVYSRAGDPVNETRLQADLMRVSDLYYENGYIFNQIENIPVKNTEDAVLSYNLRIAERNRAHIENIIIRGNEKTRESVILREIPLEPGDVFSKTKVMDGLRNLYNLQFFSAVNPETPPGSADELMDLVISVEEQSTTDLQFGAAFSGSSDPDAFPMSGFVRYNDRNIFGSGNVAGVELNLAPDTQTIGVQYTQRWMFGLPLSGSFDLSLQREAREAAMQNFAPYFYGDEEYAFPAGFSSYEEYENENKNPPEEYLMPYKQWSLSLGFGSGYRWLSTFGNLELNGGIRFGITRNSFDNTQYLPFDPILRERNNNWTPKTSIWGSLSLDKRDLFYDPSSGYYATQRLGYYGILPLEPEHYIRTDTKLEWFHTLFDIPVLDNWNFKTVFGVHSGLSFIFPQLSYGVPRIEETSQLAVDGMFNGRGWSSEYRRKGFALWENWAELRIPAVPGILAVDFFFDAAGIKKTPAAFFNDFFGDDGSLTGSNTFFMRFSFGGGIRFTLPQFPFRFSLAKRFRIRDGEVEWMRGGVGGLDFVLSFAISQY